MSHLSDEFIGAVNGWKQAIGIMRRLTDGLAFTIEEMDSESKRNHQAFGTNSEKAAKFVAAQADLRTARSYLEAIDNPDNWKRIDQNPA